MDTHWTSEFRERMRTFEEQSSPHEGGFSVSLKIRVTSGCFHREHSPNAYESIDAHISSLPDAERAEFNFIEHESGPELLVFVAAATAGISLAKSVIDLVVSILKARTEGVKRGDHPHDPVELIIRRVGEGDRFVEETILRIGHADPIKRSEIEQGLTESLKRVTGPHSVKAPGTRSKKTPKKRGSRT